MTDVHTDPSDVRLLAQERLLDAVLRVLAVRDPKFTDAVRSVLIDTVQTREVAPTGTVSLHVSQRLLAAEHFAQAYRGETV
jgi:hypothetical protein